MPNNEGNGNIDIDINSCSKKTLLRVDGIGRTLATRIIDARPFEFWDDVAKLWYIGTTRLATLKRNLTLEPCHYGYHDDAEAVSPGAGTTMCADAEDVSPGTRTPLSGKSMYGKALLRRMFVGWMLFLSGANSEHYALCCNADRNWCENWMIPEGRCLARVAARSPLFRGKAKGRGLLCEVCVRVRSHTDDRRRTHDDLVDDDYGGLTYEEPEYENENDGENRNYEDYGNAGSDSRGGRAPADDNLGNIPEDTAVVDADSSTIGASWYGNGKVDYNSKGKGKSYGGYFQKPSYKSWIYSGDKVSVSSDFAGDGPTVSVAVREVLDIPSKTDVERHNLTYSPYAAWCEIYQMSAGGEYVVDGVGSRRTTWPHCLWLPQPCEVELLGKGCISPWHTDGGSSLLHAGLPVFGSRNLEVELLGKGCISLRQQPGSFYVGNMCAMQHRVVQKDSDEGAYRGETDPFQPVQMAVMLRSDVFRNARARKANATPGAESRRLPAKFAGSAEEAAASAEASAALA